MTDIPGDFPVERLWKVSVELVRALEAAVHFVEHVDLLAGDEPQTPWPDWYPPGYVGLLETLTHWYDLLTNPPEPV